MSNEDQMTIDERRKYLRTMKKRYAQANRPMKGQLLNEMEAVTGLDRKTLIRLLHSSLARTPRSRERSNKTYGPEVDAALRIIYESADCICAERLTANLVWWADQLVAHGELHLTPALRDQLACISIPTVERHLRHICQDLPRLRRPKPKPGRCILQHIPMLRLPWDIVQPGHFEIDLVHHCGPTASGEYAYTLQMVDVATGWSERRAVLGRSYLVMEDAFRCILTRLPFQVHEIHPDNGSEFLNYHLLRFWGEVVQGVTLSRSRPFHKNDNPRVEQKNYTLVRAYLGYERLDSVAQGVALNALYDKLWLYYNLFQPVMHLVEKEIVREDGQPSRVKRRQDQATTSFDRLCRTDAILAEHRAQLDALRDAINPRRLRDAIYDAIECVLQLPCATPGVSEDVHHTLADHYHKGGDDSLDLAFNRT